jgi:hypothetical protein
VTLPIINNTECESMYEAAGFREHIPHIFICAGYREGGKDSCEVTHRTVAAPRTFHPCLVTQSRHRLELTNLTNKQFLSLTHFLKLYPSSTDQECQAL